MSSNAPGAKRIKLYCDAFFFLSLAACVVFILMLPLFPNGDGAVHIYYAHVMWSLVKHQPLYERYYAIRHLLGVYALHYFSLVFFERFFTPANAEKIFVAIIVANLAFGFRYLASRLGANSAVVSVWFLPLLLNWPLGAGFLNYCLSMGLVLWGLGLWIDLSTAKTLRPFAGLFVAVTLMVFSHPVPLLFLLIFMAVDLTFRWAAQRRSGSGEFIRGHARHFLVFCFTCSAIIVPAMLMQGSQMARSLRDIYPHPHLIRYLFEGRYIAMFGGGSLPQIFNTAGILMIVPGVVFLTAEGAWKRFRTKRTTAADRLLIFAVLFLAATMCFPDSLNGADNFPQRFWIVLWLVILACGASADIRPKRLGWMTATGVMVTAVTCFLAVRTLPGVARMQAAISRAPIPAGREGIFLEPWQKSLYDFGLTGNVFYSVGFRAATQADAILLNSPWIYQAHLPIRENGHSGLIDDYVSWYNVEPPRLLKIVSNPSPTRDNILLHSDFVFLVDPWRGKEGLTGSIQNILKDQQSQWSCSYAHYYALCIKKSERADASQIHP